MEAPWIYQREPSSGWRRVAMAGLVVASWVYRAAAWCHRAWYRIGPGRPTRLPCKVISVGNLAVGGSGKTPTVAWIATQLRRRGHRVAIASRGYGSSVGDDVHVVSDGRHVHGRFEDSGDEPMWLAARAPGIPVVVGRRRDRVGFHAVAAFDTHVLVLDDGFQHHRLARDIDLVAFHGEAGLGNGATLPRGPLREGLGALRAADGILVVDGPMADDDASKIRAAAPGAHWVAIQRPPGRLRSLANRQETSVDRLSGVSVGMLTGIARPDAFRASLERLGAEVVAQRTFPDHHPFSASDLEGLAAEAAHWVTTEKDAGKLLPAWCRDVEMDVLVLETEIAEASEFLDWLEGRLRARPQGRDVTLP